MRSRRFHAPDYRRPPGWYAHRWTFGEFLPAPFWAQDYWLNGLYGLMPCAAAALWRVWVRDGDDALLIDQDLRRDHHCGIWRILLTPICHSSGRPPPTLRCDIFPLQWLRHEGKKAGEF